MATWEPIAEYNTEVLNQYLYSLDLLSLFSINEYNEDVKIRVPTPPVAVIFWYPPVVRERMYVRFEPTYRDTYDETRVLYHMRQDNLNASAMFALIHAVANIPDIEFQEDSIVKRFLSDTSGLTPEGRGEALENDDEFAKAHSRVIDWKITSRLLDAKPENTNRKTKFNTVAFIQRNGILYELDGRKQFPINHGPTMPDDLQTHVIDVCLKGMAKRYKNNIMLLCKI